MTKANSGDHIPKRMKRQMEIVRSAPRAIFGAGHWQRTTISTTEDDEIRTESQPTEAPTDSTPLLIPGRNDESRVRDIIAKFTEQGDDRLQKAMQMTKEEKFKLVNEMWMTYVEQMLAHRKGISTVGLSGLHQRQRDDGRRAHGQ